MDLIIADYTNGSGGGFNGDLLEAAMWDRDLNSTELGQREAALKMKWQTT